MNYTTIEAMQTRFGADKLVQLTCRDLSGQLDSAVLTQAITDASVRIDASLAVRYQLPLVQVPAVIEQLAAYLAWFALHGALDEAMQRQHDAYLKMLPALAEGRLELPGLPLRQGPTTPNLTSSFQSGRRVFSTGGDW